MKIIRIENKDQPLPATLQAVVCDRFLCRLRGLMFRYSLPTNKGMLLVSARDSQPGASIHMLFVFMDLAIIWINSEYTVVNTILARSWHGAYAPHSPARYILEIHPSRINEFKIGNRVEFQHA
jgi:uncharacterized membrane protein (UPF0127 family)